PLGFIPILSFVFLGAPVIWRYHLVDITPAFAAQEVINNMSDALLVFDREGIVQLANPAFCQLSEKKEEEIKGLPVKVLLPDLFPPEEENFLPKGSRINRSFTLHLPGGGELFLEASLSPIQKNDEILAWITLIRDITELRKAQRELSQSEERYRTIFETTGSATILIEEDMTISLANREFTKIVGIPKEEIEGKRKFIQFFAPPFVSQMIEYHQRRRIAPGTAPKKITTHLLDQEGNVREVLANVDLIPHTKQSVASLVDVTDLRKAEQQIAFQLDMLSRLYRGAQELSETLDLRKLAQLAVRYSAREFEVKVAFFLTPQDNGEWEILSAFPPSSALQSWLNSPEKDQFLDDLMHNGSSLVVNFTEETKYPQLEKIAKRLAVKEVEAFLLGKPPSPLGALVWLVDKPELISSISGFIQTFVHQVATSGERAQLFSQLERYINMMHSLHSIDRTIASSLDLQMVLNLTLKEAIRHLEVNAMGVYLIDPSTQILHYRAGMGFLFPDAASYQFRPGEGTLGEVVLEKKPLFIPQIEEEDKKNLPPFIEKEKFLSLFAIPLVAKGKAQGVLIALHRLPLYPSPDWIEFLNTVGGQLAVAIDNLTMFEELNRSHLELTLAYDTTIEGWARALELRDRETEGHTRRVADLTVKLAQAL
ncbi:MAG TPA: PAS domain S-box protein, partial [Candidatus Atribacteria bacterium]|nr:PAS domain S-box protein [Candidatus Atribacteria bacterium]